LVLALAPLSDNRHPFFILSSVDRRRAQAAGAYKPQAMQAAPPALFDAGQTGSWAF